MHFLRLMSFLLSDATARVGSAAGPRVAIQPL
jgi:hypothetical protein